MKAEIKKVDEIVYVLNSEFSQQEVDIFLDLIISFKQTKINRFNMTIITVLDNRANN